MKINLHPLEGLTRFERWFLGVAWLVIIAKCYAVAWALPHYHAPIHPSIIIGPTIFFAGVATLLWVNHHE